MANDNKINLTNPISKEENLKLISPNDRESILMYKLINSFYEGGLTFNFSSHAFLGEAIDGDWKLLVTDSNQEEIYNNKTQIFKIACEDKLLKSGVIIIWKKVEINDNKMLVKNSANLTKFL